MDMAESIKKLAQQQVDGTYPTVVLFGTIIETNPLILKIDNKVYGSEFVVVPKHLTDYEIEVEARTTPSGDGHSHSINVIKIKNALKTGDKVIVLRQQGGQKYIVLDRIGG